MKCRTNKCHAHCCYNMVFENGELEKFKDRIVNPVILTSPFGMGVRAFTAIAIKDNKCPFLRSDKKCNIYECRPEVCRLFGIIERLPCEFLKK